MAISPNHHVVVLHVFFYSLILQPLWQRQKFSHCNKIMLIIWTLLHPRVLFHTSCLNDILFHNITQCFCTFIDVVHINRWQKVLYDISVHVTQEMLTYINRILSRLINSCWIKRSITFCPPPYNLYILIIWCLCFPVPYFLIPNK